MSGRSGIRLLVTGFGPFPGVANNPSSCLVKWLGTGAFDPGPDVTLTTELVPTEWEAVAKFAKDILPSLNPDIALHFGVHGRAHEIRLERRALNFAGTQADAAGRCQPGGVLVKGAWHSLSSTFDVERLNCNLAARNIPSRTSRDAGRYLCNALLYQSLAATRNSGKDCMTGFVHIPRHERMDSKTLRTGAGIIIDNCVARCRAVMRQR